MTDPSPAFGDEIPCIVTFEAPNEINSVSWSPDGTRLAIGDDAKAVEVLTAEGRSLWRRAIDSSRIWCVQWSPDGRTVASAAEGGSIRVWDSGSGEDTQLAEDEVGSRTLCWCSDGDRLAWTSGDEVRITLLPSNQVIHCDGHSQQVRGLDWSPHSSLLASGSIDETIRLWEGRTGRFVKSFSLDCPFFALSWSPDGRRLASCGDNKVQVWDTRDGQCTARRQIDQAHNLDSISWSPSGEVIAVGCDDSRVRILDPRDCREIAVLEGHSRVVWSVAFSADGTRLASAAGDRTLKIWNVEALGTPRAPRLQASAGSLYIARQAATVGRRVVPRVQGSWVPQLPEASGDCLGMLRVERGGSMKPSLDLFSDGFHMITGHPTGGIHRWDLRTGMQLWARSHGEAPWDVRVSPDDRRVASFSPGGGLRVWNAENGQELWSRPSANSTGRQVAWSPDSRRIAAQIAAHGLEILDAETGDTLWQGAQEDHYIWGVSWSPDGQQIAAATDDGGVKIWSAQSTSCLRTLLPPDGQHAPDPQLENWVKDVKWSPEGRLIAVGYRRASLDVWDTHTWEVRLRYEGHSQAGYDVSCLAWSPDGRLIASAGEDGQIRIWEAATGRDKAQFNFDAKEAWRLAWAPSGAFLVSSHQGDAFPAWDTRKLRSATPELVTDPAAAVAVPRELLPLPGALASLHRLGLHPPLSLLRDLLALTGGIGRDGAAGALAGHPGIRSLTSLRWPTPARVGLTALLLRNVPLNGWEPPPELAPAELAATLTRALHSEATEPDAPPPPIAALQNAADAIDERLLTLLEMLGAEAVATDPGLPLRLIPRLPSLPPLSAAQRRLLGLRLQSGASGRSLGHGPGSERSGVELRGDLRSLLPSQLALPAPLLASRYLRGELLYRARTGEESPRLRPAVLVLDVSPASFGPVEATTRLAAHLVASSLLAAGLPVVVVLAGGSPSTQLIERPGDIAQLWIARSLEPAEAVRTLRLARTMRETLRDGPLEPIVLLLAHTWFGAEEEAAAVPGLRGLFVQFPGHQARPPLASLCERWESLPAGCTADLADVLGRLAR